MIVKNEEEHLPRCLRSVQGIADEIVIKEPKPRRADFNLTTEFLKYKKEILEKLYQ